MIIRSVGFSDACFYFPVGLVAIQPRQVIHRPCSNQKNIQQTDKTEIHKLCIY